MRQSRKPGVVYVAVEEGGPTKIGVAVEPEARVKVLAKQGKRPVRLVWDMPHAECHRVERLVCRMLEKHRHPEFRVVGNSEWFDVPPERVIAAARRAMGMVDRKDKAAMRKLKKDDGRRIQNFSVRAHGNTKARTLQIIAGLGEAAE